jgi:hypothetical protein
MGSILCHNCRLKNIEIDDLKDRNKWLMSQLEKICELEKRNAILMQNNKDFVLQNAELLRSTNILYQQRMQL